MIESACAHRFSPIDASMRLISILHYFDCCSTKNEFFSIKCLYFFWNFENHYLFLRTNVG